MKSPVFAALATFVATAGLMTVLAGCGDRPQPTAEVQRAGFTPPVGTPLEFSWDLALPGPILRSWTSPATKDRIFFQLASTNEIVCVDITSGATRWTTAPLAKPIMGAPFVARNRVPADDQGNSSYDDDRLYVVIDDQLVVIDANTGHIVWRYELPFPPATGPVAVGFRSTLRVFIGDWNDRIQVVSYNEEKNFPFVAWQFNVGSPVVSEASSRDDLTTVADFKGAVHTFKLDREQTWNFTSGNTIQGGTASNARLTFVGNDNNTFFALNRLTGEKLGQLNLNGPVRRRPVLFDQEPERAYFWVDHADPAVGGLHAIRAQFDNIPFVNSVNHPYPLEVVRLGIDWRQPAIDRIVGSTPKHLFGTAKDSAVIQAIDRVTGEIAWTWDLAENRLAPVAQVTTILDPTDTVRSVISTDEKGHVVAYRLFRYVPAEQVIRTAAKPVDAKPVK